MADAHSLTLAFVGSHTAEAARVVESLAVADAAALFADLPARAGGHVLAAMLPSFAARVLCELEDSHALPLLADAGTQAAVAILRHVHDPRRSRLIDGLPTVIAMASQVLLGFPEDSVGAWVDPEVIALPVNTRIDAGLARLRHGAEVHLDEVMVIDHQRRLMGLVPLHAMFRAPEAATLGTLARPAVLTLPAMMPVASAAVLPAWEQTSVLPVLDRNDRLLGVLRQEKLLRVLRDRRRVPVAATNSGLAGAIALGYWTVVSRLLEASLGVLPGVNRVLPDDK